MATREATTVRSPYAARKSSLCSLQVEKACAPEGVAVDANGCPLDTDGDGVPDYRDRCPNTLPGIKVNRRGCPLRKQEDLDYLKKGIQYEFGSAKLLQSSYPVLDAVIVLLEKIPEVKLEVQGHTDIIGTEDFNQKLSEDRAHSVTDYMESKGIAADRLRAIGFGTRMPLADNVSDAGRAKNRRVELIPFGYYTEGDSTVAAPSDSLLKDSTLAPPVKGVGNGAKTAPAEIKVKLKGEADKKVRSATRAGSRWKKKAEEKLKAIVEKEKSADGSTSSPTGKSAEPAPKPAAETPKPAAETAPAPTAETPKQ